MAWMPSFCISCKLIWIYNLFYAFVFFKFYNRFKSYFLTYITILQYSIFVYMFTFIRESYIFTWIYVAVHPFASTWRTPLSISHRVYLVIMNYFEFVNLGKCSFMFIYLQFWRTVFPDMVFSVGNFFLSVLWTYHPIPF